ncbi:MAG: hypothetical protein HYX48_03445 [Chlamydiales bacterium]|nr:hypothetical protein [Chlamydiales bacterium]
MSSSNMMLQGKIISMAGQLMTNLNNGMIEANQVVRDCIKAKMTITQSLVNSTIASGLAQASGQTVSGVCGMAGGIVGIGGGLVGMYASGRQAAELATVNDRPQALAARVEEAPEAAVEMGQLRPQAPMPAQGEAGAAAPGARNQNVQARVEKDVDAAPARDNPRPLTEEQKTQRRAEIEKRWAGQLSLAKMCEQAIPGLIQGGGALGQAPYTAIAAAQQANGQKAQAISENSSTMMGSAESAAQNMQGFFSQASGMPKDSLQWAVILSQGG